MRPTPHASHVAPPALRGQPHRWAMIQGFDRTVTAIIAGLLTWASCVLSLSILL